MIDDPIVEEIRRFRKEHATVPEGYTDIAVPTRGLLDSDNLTEDNDKR